MRAHCITLILIVVVCAAAFATTLGNEFLWDDNLIIVDNPGVHDLSRPFKFFTPQYWKVIRADYRSMPRRGYRPIPELLFAVDYSLWGPNPIGYHAMSILLHAANCVLLYALALRILKNARAAAFCALLFAAHPIHVEAIAWAKARSELLALLFALVVILVYGRYLTSASPSQSLHLYICAVISFALALMCKASAVILPALLALYIWCFVPRARRRRALFGLLPLVGITAAFFAVGAALPHIPDTPQIEGGSSVLTAIAALGVYLKLLLVPAGLCAHHRIHTVQTVLDPSVLRALPLGVALLAGAVAALRRSQVAFFALGWLIIGLAPLAALELMGRRVGELRAYAPSVGFCLLVAFLLSRMPALALARVSREAVERLAIVLCVFLVGAYTGLSAVRSMDWVDEFTFWSDTVAKNPDSWHALAGLSEIYVTKGLHDKAIPYLEHLVRLDWRDRSARYRLAAAYQETGRLDDAIEVYKLLRRGDPGDARAIAALGGLYGKKSEDSKALAYLREALRAAPDSAYAHRQLGIFYTNKGRHAEALSELREALRLKPESPATDYVLGALYDAMGSHTQALRQYRRAAELRPNSPQVWLAMGACYEQLGNPEGAIRAYRRCAELPGPQAEQAKKHLSRLAGGPAGVR